ncbi:hypothetical protein KIH24_13370 [Rhizobiales bacterium TNE-4]|nr:hypothetical protein [Rhizobiales bacterium TNE-4]MBV1828608.1 hypothetical protein [Rhizobiales bacterium TNE-4]
MNHSQNIERAMYLASKELYRDALDVLFSDFSSSDLSDEKFITFSLFLFSNLNLTTEEIFFLEKVVSKNPNVKWLITLAEKYRLVGNNTLAIHTIREALTKDPECIVALAHLACWQGSVSGDCLDTKILFENWARYFRKNITYFHYLFNNLDRSLHRKLRIGYISGDFKNHSVRYFIEPFLRFHNRDLFEIHAFMTMPTDEVSTILKNFCDYWHEVEAFSDADLTAYIRDHKIDILVDLSGHTKGERLAVFVMRAAPIQVTWFGFMQTLGLSEIDWRLTDHGATPEGSDIFYTERLYRLSTMVAYAPPFETEYNFVAPYHENGFVTLICLNDSRKFSDELLKAFSLILKDNKNAGLILISREEVSDFDHVLLRRLQEHNFPFDRITIIGRQNMRAFMQLSKVADFALDSFPVSGGTTTLHALWMGLPTISLDNTSQGGLNGAGAGIMSTAGMDDCVASDIDGYVNLAGSLIKNPENIDALRLRCRIGLKNSPLMDHEARVKEVEEAYRYMWQSYLNYSMD